MTEVLWPPDLIPSAQTWTTNGNGATFNSPFVGTTHTYSRPGVRMGCMMQMPPVKGEPRARMLAVLRALKDRGNYIWVPDFSTTLETGLPARGSFAAAELLASSTFANGTTGWSAGADYAISASDRALRATVAKAISTGLAVHPTAAVASVQYAPYAARWFTAIGAGEFPAGFRIGLGSTAGGSEYGAGAMSAHGLRSLAAVASSTTISTNLTDLSTASSGTIAGQFIESSYVSVSRCALVDNGPNALLRSGEFDNATWTKVATTVSGDNIAGPDGAVTADAILETTANSTHELRQTVAIASTAADYSFSVAVRANARSFIQLAMEESTGGTAASAFFNLAGPTVGTLAAGANWSNVRAFVVDLGNSWRQVTVVARKTNAATSCLLRILLSTDGTTVSYAGTAATDMVYLRDSSFAQSSVPVRKVVTTTTATTGTTQTSSRLYVKGLPASTSGLLKAGDMVQIGGQINQLIAPLDSNAAGLGVLICGNPWRSPVDNAPVIVNTPMCKMQLASDTIDVETGPGQFSPFMLELVEVIE
jgi:hypothetical protein